MAWPQHPSASVALLFAARARLGDRRAHEIGGGEIYLYDDDDFEPSIEMGVGFQDTYARHSGR